MCTCTSPHRARTSPPQQLFNPVSSVHRGSAGRTTQMWPISTHPHPHPHAEVTAAHFGAQHQGRFPSQKEKVPFTQIKAAIPSWSSKDSRLLGKQCVNKLHFRNNKACLSYLGLVTGGDVLLDPSCDGCF